MDFQPNEDQRALQQGVRSFCEARFGEGALAALEANPLPRELWREYADLGVFALRLPEAAGGLGLGMAEAAIVSAELGRHLAPGPLLWAQAFAAYAPGVAEGECIAVALDQTSAAAASAAPLLVEYGAQADALFALRADGLYRLPAEVLAAARAIPEPLDPLTPVAQLQPPLPPGERVADAEAAAQIRLAALALNAAYCAGMAEGALALAVDYAKGREQFGRPIAGFQAIKHLAADMHVRQEMARAAAYAAACTLDAPGIGDAARAAFGARLVAGEAALRNARACIQIHGGMGFTWEMPPHYFLKRALVLAQQLGADSAHAAEVAARIAPAPTPNGVAAAGDG